MLVHLICEYCWCSNGESLWKLSGNWWNFFFCFLAWTFFVWVIGVNTLYSFFSSFYLNGHTGKDFQTERRTQKLQTFKKSSDKNTQELHESAIIVPIICIWWLAKILMFEALNIYTMWWNIMKSFIQREPMISLLFYSRLISGSDITNTNWNSLNWFLWCWLRSVFIGVVWWFLLDHFSSGTTFHGIFNFCVMWHVYRVLKIISLTLLLL